jgi:hypothetical protein
MDQTMAHNPDINPEPDQMTVLDLMTNQNTTVILIRPLPAQIAQILKQILNHHLTTTATMETLVMMTHHQKIKGTNLLETSLIPMTLETILVRTTTILVKMTPILVKAMVILVETLVMMILRTSLAIVILIQVTQLFTHQPAHH